MILRTLTYQEALTTHPEAVKEIKACLRKSRSKHRYDEPDTFKWCYQCCVVVTGGEPQELESKIADRTRRTSTSLQVTKGHWYHSVTVPNPPEVEEWHRKTLTEQLERTQAYAKLKEENPEEWQRQMQDTLSKLNGSPGFFAFRVVRNDSDS